MSATKIKYHQYCQPHWMLAACLFCLTLSAGRAAIVHQEFEIPNVNGWPVIGLPSNPYLFDIDNDGVTDLIFRNGSEGFAVFPQAGSAVLAVESGPNDLNSFAAPLAAGEQVGSLAPVSAFWDADGVNGSLLTSARDVGTIGLFTGQIAYLGIQFTRNNQVHYGWLHMDVSYVGLNAGNLLAAGWEDTPELGIAAGAVPEPSIWSLLAGCGLFLFFANGKKVMSEQRNK